MTARPPYEPIDCEFHDELEAASTLRKTVVLVVLDESGAEVELRSVITDLGIGEECGVRAEFMTLASGERIRLDRIIRIDGMPRP